MSRRQPQGPKLNVQRRNRNSAIDTTLNETLDELDGASQNDISDNTSHLNTTTTTTSASHHAHHAGNVPPAHNNTSHHQVDLTHGADNSHDDEHGGGDHRDGDDDDDEIDLMDDPEVIARKRVKAAEAKRQQQLSAAATTTTTSSSINTDPFNIAGGAAEPKMEDTIESHFTHDFSRLYTDPATTLEHQVESKLLIQIQNMVGVVDLGTQIDMKKVAMCARNAEYNPRRFMSVVLRLREPKTTALLFKSGKLVVTGGKSEYHTHLAARKFARLIQRIGHPDVVFKDFGINNIVGTVDVRFPIDLNAFVKQHSQHCEYDPELFPSLVYRLHEPNVVVLIFVNGKIIITGAKDRIQLYTAFEILYPVICEYRKGGAYSTYNTLGIPLLAPNPALASAMVLGAAPMMGAEASFGLLDPTQLPLNASNDYYAVAFNNGLQTTEASLLGSYYTMPTTGGGMDDGD